MFEDVDPSVVRDATTHQLDVTEAANAPTGGLK